MNCFGPDFVLLHKAVSCFPHEITSYGETHCPLIQICVGQILHAVSQPDLVRKLSILFKKRKKKIPRKETKQTSKLSQNIMFVISRNE